MSIEAGLYLTNRRIDDLDRKVMGHLMLIYRELRKRNGHGRKSLWLQIGTMAAIALSSILGLVKPEMAAALMRALLQ